MTDREKPFLDEARLNSAVLHWRLECGQRMRERRKALGLSQETLALKCGIRTPSISRIEMGLQAPTDATRIAIACVLHVELNEIWPPMDRFYVTALARAA